MAFEKALEANEAAAEAVRRFAPLPRRTHCPGAPDT